MEVPDQKPMRDVELSVGNTDPEVMVEELSVEFDLPMESFSADLDIIERARAGRMKADALDERTLDEYLCECGSTCPERHSNDPKTHGYFGITSSKSARCS